MWGPTLFFNVRISSCLSTNCWKDYLFPIEWSWHYCQKSLDHIHEGYIWALYSIPLVYMFVFMARTHQHIIVIIVASLSFEIRTLSLSPLFFFWKIIFTISLEIHMNFRMGFSISAVNVMEVKQELHWIYRLLW